MAIDILLIDDDVHVCVALRTMLTRQGYKVLTAHSGEDGLAMCTEKMPALVLLDVGLPGIDGLETLRRIKAMANPCPVVMATAYETASMVVTATKLGASEYLVKPVTMEDLYGVVAKLVGLPKVHAKEESCLDGVIGASASMLAVFKIVHRVAKTGATVLLTGESGTGKEVLARAIHDLSNRKKAPFVSINCASIPGNLLESELFGHDRGAFTDARTDKQGLVEVAQGGTLFLDEIGLMPLDIQGKILRLLETRRFRRLGGNQEREAQVRFVASTNADLEAGVSGQTFREDLFYRLNVIPIHLPPLRERGKDVLVLARHFLADFSRRHGVPKQAFAPEAEILLSTYLWPGNVREMKNVIERAVLLSEGTVIDAEDLSIDQRANQHQKASEAVSDTAAVSVSKTGLIKIAFPPWGISLDDLERQVIEEALKFTSGNISRAARLLHISRHTLRYRMQKHGIDETPH